MKYFKYFWLVMIVLVIFVRAYGYEKSYIKREILMDPPLGEVKVNVFISMVFDPVDEIYYNLEDFNDLTIEQLKHFKGIGDVIASSIVDHIKRSGGLESFYELTEIKGIGEKKLEGILENSK